MPATETPFQVSNHTIDLLVQASYKYRVTTKRGRTLFGRQLIAANQAALAASVEGFVPLTWEQINDVYTFTPIARKFKRAAVAGALHCFEQQAINDPTYRDGEVHRLLQVIDAKNARLAGFSDETDGDGHYDEDDEWVEPIVLRTAVEIMRDADEQRRFWDITAEQRDAESEDFDNSIMVRPIGVIRAERDAEAERIRQERMAAAAERHAEMNRADDEDEDDWDDVDDEYEDDEDDDES